jgi:F-type H+-transporting ATPase subunit b
MRLRRVLLALTLCGAVNLVFAAPANAASKKQNEEIQKCVDKAVESGGDAIDCANAPKPVLPATGEIVWGGLAFLVLFGVMYKKAFPMAKKAMEARTEKIRNDLDSADRANAEAEQKLAEYQRQLADAKSESNRIIEEARSTAEQMRRDLITRAEEEGQQLRDRNREELEGAKERMIVDLRSEVTSLAIELAEKVVEKNIDRDTNAKLIDQYISQVGAGSKA